MVHGLIVWNIGALGSKVVVMVVILKILMVCELRNLLKFDTDQGHR